MKHFRTNHASLQIHADTGGWDFARRRSLSIIRLAFLAVFASIGLVALVQLFTSDRFSSSKPTDFAQDYAMGRAILEGKDPYASLETLTSEFGLSLWHHPCPHPPPVALIMSVIAVVPYERAMFIWLALSVAGLFIAVRILFGLNWFSTPIWFFIALLWYPIHDDLVMGQIMSILLMLLALAWSSFRNGRQISTGIFIGLVLSLKLIAWPMIIYFVIKRNFRCATSALATFMGTNIIAGLVMGFDRLPYYYWHVGTMVAGIYRTSPFNYSIFSIGPRLFSGTRSTLENLLRSDPLINAPDFASMVSALLAVIAFCAVFYFTIRCTDQERAFAVLICLSIILSPTAWWFYFVLLLIPLTTAAKMKGSFGKVAIASCLVAPYIPALVPSMFGVNVSYWIGLLMLTPLLSIGLLIVSVLSTELRMNKSAKHNQIRVPGYQGPLSETA